MRPQPERPIAPSESFIGFAENLTAARGHENAGFLSRARGYLPRSDPKKSLAPSHRAWDEAAALLPALYENAKVRRALLGLPLLSGRRGDLCDEDVLRATALLAILSHAYWYCLPSPVSELPEALARPWAELRQRLGRSQEVITYIDLIVYNWQRKDPDGPLIVSNLSLLFPTIGNQEEQVFYLTQLEILARSSALLGSMIAAQSAVCTDDVACLERELDLLAKGLAGIVQESLPKISPQSRHPHHVDAVTWAKSVAPFAVPFRPGIQGPSGTSSPIFNTLDLFFGRERYESFLGREIRDLRGTYPTLWRGLLRRIGRVDVGAYVLSLDSPALSDAWAGAMEAYKGPDGFLGRHRTKVYGFLELAFKVGRSLTIGGFGGAFRDRTWDEVDDALESSRAERPDARPSVCSAVSAAVASRASADRGAGYFFSEVAEHNSPERGFWLAIGSSVYDVTRFRTLHPGGERIIDAYAGMDATHGFERAHRGRANAAKMLAQFRIGELVEPPVSDDRQSVVLVGRDGAELSSRLLYRAYLRALNLCVEMQNALVIDLSFARLTVHPGSEGNLLSAYKVARLAEAHERFCVAELGVLARETFPRLTELSLAWMDTMRSQESRTGTRPDPSELTLLDTQIARAGARVQEIARSCADGTLNAGAIEDVLAEGRLDVALITAIKRELIQTLRLFEAGLDEPRLSRALLETHTRVRELVVLWATPRSSVKLLESLSNQPEAICLTRAQPTQLRSGTAE